MADRPQTWRTGTKAGTQYITDWPITIVYSHTAEYWHNTSITLSIYVIETVTHLSERLNAHKGITDYNKLTYCRLFIIVTNYIAFHDFQSSLIYYLHMFYRSTTIPLSQSKTGINKIEALNIFYPNKHKVNGFGFFCCKANLTDTRWVGLAFTKCGSYFKSKNYF